MKQLIVLIITICASILAGILPTPKYTSLLFEYTGYYFIFVSFFLWVFYLFRLYAAKLKSILLDHWGGLLFSTALMVLIFSIAPPRFKVLSDETNLIGISMAMYQLKKTSLPLRGFNIDYRKPEYTSKIDKRPIFYSFLVSMIHALRGYSANNGFVVNFICGTMVLLIFYLFIYDLFPRIYAFLSVLMIASLPNFVIWVTSSGFETLNLFFIVLTLYLFKKVSETRSIPHAELLFLTLVLVSQCRYESIIFTVAILFLIPLLLDKNSIRSWSIVTYVTPILFIPTLWLPRLWADRPIIDQMAMGTVQVPSLFEAFSVSNLVSNTSANLIVFLGLDPHLGFSPVISAMALAGLYLMAKKMIVERYRIASHSRALWWFGGLTFGLLYIIQASFYLGDMTIVTQNRFALAFLPYLVLPAIFFIHEIVNKINVPFQNFILIFFGFHLLYFWPYGSQQLLVNGATIPYEYNKTLNYLKGNYDSQSKILVICERPNYYVVQFPGALDFEFANQNPDQVLYKGARDFDHVLVMQKYRYETGEPLMTHRLSNSYQLFKMIDLRLTQSEYLRISELTNPS